MVRQFSVHSYDYELWDVYHVLALPTLVLRGEHSDLLRPETAQQMTQCGPRAQLVEIAKRGHAPCLSVAGQIELVRMFLASSI